MAITLKTYCMNSILDTFAFEISPAQSAVTLFSVTDLFKLSAFLQIYLFMKLNHCSCIVNMFGGKTNHPQCSSLGTPTSISPTESQVCSTGSIFFVTANKLDQSWKTYPGQLIHWLPRMSQSTNSLSFMSLNQKKHGNRFQSSMPLNSNIFSYSPRKLDGALVSIICMIKLWLGFPNINFLLKYEMKSLSRVQLFVTPWTVAYQAPQFMEFSRQEYQSGLPFPSPWDLPDLGMESGSPALQADTLPSEPPGKSSWNMKDGYLNFPCPSSPSLKSQIYMCHLE